MQDTNAENDDNEPRWTWKFGTTDDGTHVLTGQTRENQINLRLTDEDLMFLADCASQALDGEIEEYIA
jgi:hypothetical protein